MRHLSFDLAQAGAAVRAGCVLSAILLAGNGTYDIELETRESGLAALVTANDCARSANPARRSESFGNWALLAAAALEADAPSGPGESSSAWVMFIQ